MILDTAIKARIAGAFYFMAVCAAISGEAFVRGRLTFAIGLLAVACFGWVRARLPCGSSSAASGERWAHEAGSSAA